MSTYACASRIALTYKWHKAVISCDTSHQAAASILFDQQINTMYELGFSLNIQIYKKNNGTYLYMHVLDSLRDGRPERVTRLR
jgi:hypothetical protein